MSELGIATAASDKIVLAVVSHLNEGQIDDALALFDDDFNFKDHGIGLEFNTKDRLAVPRTRPAPSSIRQDLHV